MGKLLSQLDKIRANLDTLTGSLGASGSIGNGRVPRQDHAVSPRQGADHPGSPRRAAGWPPVERVTPDTRLPAASRSPTRRRDALGGEPGSHDDHYNDAHLPPHHRTDTDGPGDCPKSAPVSGHSPSLVTDTADIDPCPYCETTTGVQPIADASPRVQAWSCLVCGTDWAISTVNPQPPAIVSPRRSNGSAARGQSRERSPPWPVSRPESRTNSCETDCSRWPATQPQRALRLITLK
jgi:hypothetical protein